MVTKSKVSKKVKKPVSAKKPLKTVKSAKKVVSVPLKKTISKKTKTPTASAIKRKKIQTAEGWKRNMAKIRQQKLAAKRK